MVKSVPPRAGVAPSAAGRLAGVLMQFGAVATLANMIVNDSRGDRRMADLAVSAATMAVGILAMILPWDRWNDRMTLTLLPPVLGLLAFGNYTNPDPYIAGTFFIVIAVWTGLCHRRYTTLVISPALLFALWAPLKAQEHLPSLEIASLGITGVAVMVGEVLGSLRARLDRAQDDLLSSRERRFDALIQRSSDITMVVDRDGVIAYVSPAVATAFGYEVEALEQTPLGEFMAGRVRGLETDRTQVAGDSTSNLLDNASAAAEQGDVVELQVLHADGGWIDVESVMRDLTNDPDIEGIVFNIRDIHARKDLERQLHRQAFTDDLTGLPNRARFLAVLEDLLAEQARLSVLFVDLDGFKTVNDTSGHEGGDELLRLVARRFANALEPTAVLARLGGDEFAVIAPGSPDSATRQAERLVAALDDPFQIAEQSVGVTASVGVAHRVRGVVAEDLIRNADTAMYAAKEQLGGATAVYEPAMRRRLVDRLRIETELRRAIDLEQFVVHYQPVVDLASRRTIGAEALVRWNHPERGLMPPGDFIEVAERSGVILPLGRWVLGQACEEATRWQVGGRSLGVAVNVSSRQFQDADLVRDVRLALEMSGLDPALLKLEITESVLINDIERTADRLHELRAIGVRLALDDFGTGYSSMRYLQRLPFDVLKIDKSFVDHLATNGNDRTLVGTIARMGHDLGLTTLAEGLESAEQATLAHGLGVDQGQGYLFSKPVPAADVRRLLADDRPEPYWASGMAMSRTGSVSVPRATARPENGVTL